MICWQYTIFVKRIKIMKNLKIVFKRHSHIFIITQFFTYKKKSIILQLINCLHLVSLPSPFFELLRVLHFRLIGGWGKFVLS